MTDTAQDHCPWEHFRFQLCQEDYIIAFNTLAEALEGLSFA
jgi:hypothetical protein